MKGIPIGNWEVNSKTGEFRPRKGTEEEYIFAFGIGEFIVGLVAGIAIGIVIGVFI